MLLFIFHFFLRFFLFVCCRCAVVVTCCCCLNQFNRNGLFHFQHFSSSNFFLCFFACCWTRQDTEESIMHHNFSSYCLCFFDFVYHWLHFKDHCVRSIISKAYRWIVCYVATSFFPYSSWIWLWVVFVYLFLVCVDSLMDMRYELCVVDCYAMNRKKN